MNASLPQAPREKATCCLVLPHGLDNHDGIALAFQPLMQSIARLGLGVDLLDVARRGRSPAIRSASGINWIPLPPPSPSLIGSRARQNSYEVMQWLLARPASYRTVYFLDREGIGFYTSLIRHQGLGLQSTQLGMILHMPTAWQRAQAMHLPTTVEELEIDFMERESIRLADAVLSPGPVLVGELEGAGFPLPARRFILPQAEGKEWIDPDWLAWQQAREQSSSDPAAVPADKTLPFVSVCLVHFNRPHLLRQALESLRAQDYTHFEVILLDGGSTLPEAHAYLQELAPEFTQRGWSIVREDDRYLGAARNDAAAHAKGDYFLFMDDDNVARPEEIRVLVEVAQKTGAAIVTCAHSVFSGSAPPPHPPEKIIAPLGSALALGAFWNAYGDANALVSRDAFLGSGKFTEIVGVGHEDWEFFARACLRGFHLEAVPLPLYAYRTSPSSMTNKLAARTMENHWRSLQPLLETVRPELRASLEFGLGSLIIFWEERRKSEARAAWLRRAALIIGALLAVLILVLLAIFRR